MSPPEPPEIDPQWVAWVTENLLRGNPRADIVSTLAGQGVELETARRIVTRVASDPIFAASLKVLRRSAGTEQAARLQRRFQRLHALDATLDDAHFYHLAWTPHRPVVARGIAADWPEWSLEGLAERFPDASVDVLRGRSAHTKWWRHRDALATSMPLPDLVEHVLSESGDDLYGVGRNDLLESLPGLKSDLRRLPGLRDTTHARLWMGPAGTVTPLHHDQSSAWLVQRVGRKRVWLASPLEPALWDTADGVFNSHDPREPATGDLSEVHWWETVIEPGDAVFFPAGWWHQVVSESPSVSVSLGSFRWPHTVEWYAPGRYGGRV